jgi:hypothetical protein
MKQEDKDLLLKDLCARLTYGIKVNNEIQGDFKIYGICENFVFGRNEVCHIDFDIEKIKPYLFPLSSMDKKQTHKFLSTCNGYCEYNWTEETFDWFNKNHIDYRGLIEKGLAIDATGLNIY